MDPFDESRYRFEDEDIEEYLFARNINQHKHSTWKSRRLFTQLNHLRTVGVAFPPDVYIRRFTPDGQYLVTFAKNQKSVICYKVNAIHKDLATTNHPFDELFQDIWEAKLSCDAEILCKDFCLCVGKYLMIATGVPSPTIRPSLSPEHPRTLSSYSHIDHVTFYLIDSSTGKVSDQVTFSNDMIILSHHAGVALCGDRFAVLSAHHQVIHVLRLHKGKFYKFCQIGHKLIPNEELLIPPFSRERDHEHRRFDGFHQKLFGYLFEQAQKNGRTCEFHRNQPSIDQLHFWKVQFVDEQHMLIRLGSSDYFTQVHGSFLSIILLGLRWKQSPAAFLLCTLPH